MPTFRVNKNKDYTVMSNYHLKDKRMSLKAKGLLSEMLSLPEDWDYSIEGLASINKESTKQIKLALEELKRYQYLYINKLMPNQTESGRIEYVYDIYEMPKTRTPKQPPCFEKQEPQNNPLVLGDNKYINININNTNNKILNKKEKIKKEKEETYFENEEVNKIFIEFLQQRKKLKAVNSDRAISLLKNKLNNLL